MRVILNNGTRDRLDEMALRGKFGDWSQNPVNPLKDGLRRTDGTPLAFLAKISKHVTYSRHWRSDGLNTKARLKLPGLFGIDPTFIIRN